MYKVTLLRRKNEKFYKTNYVLNKHYKTKNK
jgi:hypothetical protein